MSITLPVVDLSNAVVGQTGVIPLQSSGLASVPSDKLPYLQIYNDSGAGLLITLAKSQLQFYLSAKGHILAAISNAEGQIAYQVMNVSTNIQTNQLWAVYYYPGENIPDFSALGTSTVSQQATTLINTGNPVATTIIFSEPLGDNSPSGAINITNSGLIEAGDTVNSGKIVISGTHVALAATNNIFPDEINILGANAQEVDLLVSGSDSFITLKNQAGSSIVKLQTLSPALDLSNLATGLTAIKFIVGSITRLNVFTGSANNAGTLQAHGLGVKPDFVVFQETGTVGDTNTFSWDVAASDATNVKVWTNNATARNYIALAIKL